jgi:hypothetical protein
MALWVIVTQREGKLQAHGALSLAVERGYINDRYCASLA